MTAQEYEKLHQELMEKWAAESRSWIEQEGGKSKATFYKDGVVDPATWFDKPCRIRPLFVLKEVSDTEFQEVNKSVNFLGTGIGDPICDVWAGQDSMWRKMGSLAAGIFQLSDGHGDIPEYHLFSVEELDRYHDTLKKVAIINLKKMASGTETDSEQSQATLDCAKHADHFREYLYQQIAMINPTIIICCGQSPNIAKCLSMENGKICGIPAIDGYHPSRNSIENFYYRTLSAIQSNL